MLKKVRKEVQAANKATQGDEMHNGSDGYSDVVSKMVEAAKSRDYGGLEFYAAKLIGDESIDLSGVVGEFFTGLKEEYNIYSVIDEIAEEKCENMMKLCRKVYEGKENENKNQPSYVKYLEYCDEYLEDQDRSL